VLLSLVLRGPTTAGSAHSDAQRECSAEIAMQAKTILQEATNEIGDMTKKLQKQARND